MRNLQCDKPIDKSIQNVDINDDGELDICDNCGAKVYETVHGLCEACQYARGWL